MKRTTVQSREHPRQRRDLILGLSPVRLVSEVESRRDEHDCLVGGLMRRLEKGAAETELNAFLRDVTANRFGIPGLPRLPELASLVKAWYETHGPDSNIQNGLAE